MGAGPDQDIPVLEFYMYDTDAGVCGSVAVPAPAGLGLLFAGAAGVAAIRCRQRAAA